jgi:hypothetical protein
MLAIPGSYLGNQFFGKFQNVPAIICGAGPSLAKNISLLGRLLDHAVVFAGGSALNALNAHFFHPHFGAGIDPNPMQYERMISNQAFEVPFFYRNRLYHDAFRMIRGPRLYITGSGGYDIADYFEEKFKIKAGFLDEGHNVVNFCLEIANAMGCNPIIFVGMDLAFTGMKAYAPGIVEDARVSKAEILEADDYDSKALLRKDIDGKPTFTLWKWIAEADWIGNFAKTHPLLTMINCTEGGLGFPGIPNQTLKNVAEKYLKRQIELNDRVHGETQNSRMPQVSQRKVNQAMSHLAESLRKTYRYLNILLEEAEGVFHKVKQGQVVGSIIQSGRAALAETELAEEDGYRNVISIFNEVQSRILSRELHRINIGSFSEKQKTLKRLALNIKRLKFLRNAAQVNYELIDYAFDEFKKQKRGKKLVIKAPHADPGCYSLKDQMLTIVDPELGLDIHQPFDPIQVPKRPQNGQKLKDGCELKVFFNERWTISECYIEKNGKPHGQCLLYYPSGTIKQEVFYLEGRLHGPSTFWSEKGMILAKSWFMEGKRQGKSQWYYPSGAIYSIQRFRDGLWEGQQEYFDEKGQVKRLMNYHKGRLVTHQDRMLGFYPEACAC